MEAVAQEEADNKREYQSMFKDIKNLVEEMGVKAQEISKGVVPRLVAVVVVVVVVVAVVVIEVVAVVVVVVHQIRR